MSPSTPSSRPTCRVVTADTEPATELVATPHGVRLERLVPSPGTGHTQVLTAVGAAGFGMEPGQASGAVNSSSVPAEWLTEFNDSQEQRDLDQALAALRRRQERLAEDVDLITWLALQLEPDPGGRCGRGGAGLGGPVGRPRDRRVRVVSCGGWSALLALVFVGLPACSVASLPLAGEPRFVRLSCWS
jgi:hypothetical protein